MDNTDPAIQVHAYNEHTYILRENKAINYEGAFMYLFFGNGVAMLIDQGSTSSPALFPLREVVDQIIRGWEEQHNSANTELIVANSHLHGDHYAAWNQFGDRPNTVMVGLTHEEMMTITKLRTTRSRLSPTTSGDASWLSLAHLGIRDRNWRSMMAGLTSYIPATCFIAVGCT